MKLNGITKIDESKGKYIVVCDYHDEGLRIVDQYDSLAEAVQCALAHSGGACSVLELTEVGEL